MVSEVDEDERDFRIRLQHLAHEKRDEALDALRKKYASKINTLEDRQRRAKQALESRVPGQPKRKWTLLSLPVLQYWVHSSDEKHERNFHLQGWHCC